MTIRSLEQTKVFMSLTGITIGVLAGIYFRPFDITTIVVSIVFITIGILLGLDSGYARIVFNKSGESFIEARRGTRTGTTTFKLDDIQYIEKLEYTGIGNGSSGPNDILRLVIKSQDHFEIAATRQNNLLIRLVPSLRPYRRQGQKIAFFLGKEYRLKRIDPLKEFFGNPSQKDPSDVQ